MHAALMRGHADEPRAARSFGKLISAESDSDEDVFRLWMRSDSDSMQDLGAEFPLIWC